MEYAVTPKLVDPTNIPQELYGLQRYAGSSLFIDSTLILCSAVCYATLTPLMVRLLILPRIRSVSARNCNCIIPMEVCCLKWFWSPGNPECQSAMDYLLTGNINWSWHIRSGAVTPRWYYSICRPVVSAVTEMSRIVMSSHTRNQQSPLAQTYSLSRIVRHEGTL